MDLPLSTRRRAAPSTRGTSSPRAARGPAGDVDFFGVVPKASGRDAKLPLGDVGGGVEQEEPDPAEALAGADGAVATCILAIAACIQAANMCMHMHMCIQAATLFISRRRATAAGRRGRECTGRAQRDVWWAELGRRRPVRSYDGR